MAPVEAYTGRGNRRGAMRLRCFVAVPLEGEVHGSAVGFLRRLAALAPAVKWVEPENLHFTLKFLGEVEEGRLEKVKAALGQALAGKAAFGLELCGAGAFPNLRRPRVVWLGAGAGRDRLGELAEAVESALAPLGFPREARAFSPHLTLGRARQPGAAGALAAELEAAGSRPWGELKVDRVVLMQSTLTPRGPIYTPLAVFRL
ncbi:MAG: RNA 2',3'-cyclic phosphodiesterase [Acetobacteraceae bacterium]|nr:RNA 2',3'-cyclic phosphodiesterase [Acetobacteraceae bacterium]